MKTNNLVFFLLFFFFSIVISAQTPKSILNNDFKPSVVQSLSENGFVHPGILLSAQDFNRIQEMVRLGYEPWASAFNKFRRLSKSSKSYQIQNKDAVGNAKYIVMGDGNGQYEARQDADAAFAQTIMWYITGDMDYSRKALEIIRLWSSSIEKPTGDMLTGGMTLQKFCLSAEILRYTPNSGWTENDNILFSRFLKIMLPGVDKPTAFMNQGSIATMGYISAAVFLNDMDLYRKAIVRATVGKESKSPLRDYSIKNQIREVTNPTTGESLIILVEMGRDQGHAQGDVGALGSIARTSFIQKTKVNSEGEIDINGVDLFSFLDNRILKGAVLTSKYNLGYDINYPPTNVGSAQRPEVYNMVSSDMRGQLAPVYALIYNHYKYEKGLEDTDASMKSIREVLQFIAPEAESTDFPGSGTLLFTDEKEILNPRKPIGSPQPLLAENYQEKSKLYLRIPASDFTGSKGDKTGDVNIEYFYDSEGARRVISGVKDKFYIWYKDVDFGSVPVSKMIINAGSAGTNGCKMDVILLDHLADIKRDNVTEADLNAGEKIAVISLPATGWWSNYVITTAMLNRTLTGKHSFALRLYGSGHVYRFQANVDWFKFANSSSGSENPISRADVFFNGASVYKDGSVKMNNNSAVLFKTMDIDNGLGLLQSSLKTTGNGMIEIRKGSNDGALLASYPVISTKGKWIDYRSSSVVPSTEYGIKDIYITFKGKGVLFLKSFRNISLKKEFKPVQAKDISIVYSGKAVLNSDFASITALKEGTTVVFPQVEFKNGPRVLAMKVRSRSEATLFLTNMDKTNRSVDNSFLNFSIPNTNGEWKTIYVNMERANKKLNGQHMLYMKIKGNGGMIDFEEMQFDPIVIDPKSIF